jgi:CheY-like chemotaxis protein
MTTPDAVMQDAGQDAVRSHIRKLTVLVVDDTLIGRATVTALLRRLGIRYIEAADGNAAIRAFRTYKPDIVLMDVEMPGMDGLEATRELRRLSSGTWLPILLLSARSDDEDMIAGLEAGADDYLAKPIRRAILVAKLSACARQLSMQASMAVYRAEQEAEIEFAGDIVALSQAPSGARYALLADATGHGMAAAISALPVLQVFFGMAAKNLTLQLMAGEMNRHLMSTLPIGRFVAASMVRLGDGFGELWVGGTPDVLWLDSNGVVKERFISSNLPLGIDGDDAMSVPPRHFRWTPGDQLVLCSDGLIEAQNALGDPFGIQRLEDVLRSCAPTERHDSVRRALAMHLDGASAHDDVSLMVMDLD